MGFLSDILGVAAPIAGAYFGGPTGAAIGGAVGGLLGGEKAYGQEQAAAAQARAAAAPVSVFGPGGSSVYNAANNSLNLSIQPKYQRGADQAFEIGRRGLDQYSVFRPQGFNVAAETDRLRQLRAPDIAQARSSLQSQLLKRGRLGLGVGGGRTGQHYQPESAALEEAILSSQLSDIGHAQNTAFKREALDYDRQGQMLDNARGLFNLGGSLQGGAQSAANLGLQGRLPSGIAALQAVPGSNRASTTRGFFSALGATDWSGIFGDDDADTRATDSWGF